MCWVPGLCNTETGNDIGFRPYQDVLWFLAVSLIFSPAISLEIFGNIYDYLLTLCGGLSLVATRKCGALFRGLCSHQRWPFGPLLSWGGRLQSLIVMCPGHTMTPSTRKETWRVCQADEKWQEPKEVSLLRFQVLREDHETGTILANSHR